MPENCGRLVLSVLLLLCQSCNLSTVSRVHVACFLAYITIMKAAGSRAFGAVSHPTGED
jgi:hypothetical protein